MRAILETLLLLPGLVLAHGGGSRTNRENAMNRKLAGLTVFMLTLAAGAFAKSDTGPYGIYLDARQFRDLIESDNEFDQNMATGYILGHIDATAGYHLAEPEAITGHCIPSGLTGQQTVDKVVETIKRFPAMKKDVGATILVGMAIYIAWPCPGVKLPPLE